MEEGDPQLTIHFAELTIKLLVGVTRSSEALGVVKLRDIV